MAWILECCQQQWVFLLPLPRSASGCWNAGSAGSRRKQEEQNRKDEARRKNEIIVIEGVNAAIALGEATARAVERIPDVHCNGDMHRALEYADKIKHKHKVFMTEQGVESIY